PHLPGPVALYAKRLRGRQMLVARAEGTVGHIGGWGRWGQMGRSQLLRALGALHGDDYRLPRHDVMSDFWHGDLARKGQRCSYGRPSAARGSSLFSLALPAPARHDMAIS